MFIGREKELASLDKMYRSGKLEFENHNFISGY